jgi:cytochrome c-type biogenesis protein CcsB
LVCYAIASVLFARNRIAGSAVAPRSATIALGLGAAMHALGLTGAAIATGAMPVADFAGALSFLAWLTALCGLVVIVRLRISAIGAFVAPLVTVAYAASTMMMLKGSRIVLPAPLRSIWLPVHVTLAIAGYTMFVLAASVSLVYLAYENRLKGKRPLDAGAIGAPSLEKLDRINYRLLGWGFTMLTMAIVSGAIWADATWGHFWSWEPKESWSALIWILYAGLLELRMTVGWRGRRAAALTIAVFGVLVGSFIGVNMIFPGKHAGSFG